MCGRCGATAPLSARPYQECASCHAVSDYDFGVARQHVDWPGHEARLAQLFARYSDRLSSAAASADRDGYAQAYTDLLRQLIHMFPALYPSRAAHEPAYRDQLAAFHAAWQAATAIEAGIVHGDSAFRALRSQVQTHGKHVRPESLWPLIDHAMQLFDAIQRAIDPLPPGAPDDFVPGYVKRFMISNTVAEWLPQLKPDAQRELVTRMGVTREYVAPAAGHVACPNCGGTVEVTPGFLTVPCPYCSAEIEEARAEYRDVERARYEGGDYDTAFGAVELLVRQHAQRLQILDGEVTRKGKPYRMIILRAAFADRAADFWWMFDIASSKKLAAAIGWIEDFSGHRKLPLDRFAYREHPRCKELPHSVEELAQRLVDTSPGAQPYTAGVGRGSVVEVVAGGAIVRLLYDEDGKRTKMIRSWLGA